MIRDINCQPGIVYNILFASDHTCCIDDTSHSTHLATSLFAHPYQLALVTSPAPLPGTITTLTIAVS